VDVGRRLFRDRHLSRDGSMACVSCHDPRRAFTNGEKVGKGVGGARGTRNVPSIINRAWGRSFFWDGRAPTLEDQVLQPILHRTNWRVPPIGSWSLRDRMGIGGDSRSPSVRQQSLRSNQGRINQSPTIPTKD
jgi:hypothetical protein